MKKAQGNALLQTLEPDTQELLYQACQSGTYAEALEWLRRDVFTTGQDSSISSLERWFSWYGRCRRFVQSEATVSAVETWAAEKLPGLEPEKIVDLLSMVHLVEAGEKGKTGDYVKIAKFLTGWMKDKDAKQQREAAEKMAAAEKVGSEEISLEERRARMRALFGK